MLNVFFVHDCIFPNHTLEGSNNHRKSLTVSDAYPIPTDIFNLHIYILPKLFAAYIQHRYIFQNIYIPQPCARRAHRNYPTYIHPPNCWHDISNTNIYIQRTYIPQIVGSIYSIQIYISTNLYSQTPAPEGRTETPTIHPAPKCWPDISNTHICNQLTFVPQIVGCIYPITFSYF